MNGITRDCLAWLPPRQHRGVRVAGCVGPGPRLDGRGRALCACVGACCWSAVGGLWVCLHFLAAVRNLSTRFCAVGALHSALLGA